MDYLIPMALAILLDAVKNPIKRRVMKVQFAKVVRSILMAYGSDREFLEMAGLLEKEG